MHKAEERTAIMDFEQLIFKSECIVVTNFWIWFDFDRWWSKFPIRTPFIMSFLCRTCFALLWHNVEHILHIKRTYVFSCFWHMCLLNMIYHMQHIFCTPLTYNSHENEHDLSCADYVSHTFAHVLHIIRTTYFYLGCFILVKEFSGVN